MNYTRISADCHIDLPWIPPDLFTSNATASMKARMPFVTDGPDGPYWTSRNGTSFGLMNGVGPAGAKYVPGMHHRVDMLTVEFNDGRGGNHAAVFFLPANEAERALENFALTPVPPRKVSEAVCRNAAVEPRSVLVPTPNWDHAEVPAAYRGLVYEHIIDRLRRTKEVGQVYRDGDGESYGGCPQYIVHISIATFKQGISVQRAFLGPVGMFVGTTQMKFDVTFTDASGKLNTREQITATMRGESENTNVADHVAKSLAKRYAAVLKNDKTNSAKNTVNPAS